MHMTRFLPSCRSLSSLLIICQQNSHYSNVCFIWCKGSSRADSLSLFTQQESWLRLIFLIFIRFRTKGVSTKVLLSTEVNVFEENIRDIYFRTIPETLVTSIYVLWNSQSGLCKFTFSLQNVVERIESTYQCQKTIFNNYSMSTGSARVEN